MSFLNFLKGKGVSANVIVEAAIWQQENSKSLLSHLKSHPHITGEMIFSLLDESSDTGLSMEQVQREKSYIPTQYYAECLEDYERSLDSIASFLVEKGHIRLEEYEAALLEYMASNGPHRNQAAKVATSPAVAATTPEAPGQPSEGDDSDMISDAALESLRELIGSGGLDESTIAELESSKKK